MASGHEQHGAAASPHGPRVLPAVLASPELVKVWRSRALIVGVVFTLVSLVFAFTSEGRDHILRAYLLGFMTCFGFAGGGLCLLMLQYVSGGKWGLLLRRPLEAMARTLPLVALGFLPIGFAIALDGEHVEFGVGPDADRRHRLIAVVTMGFSGPHLGLEDF